MVLPSGPPVLRHTEVMRQHLLAGAQGDARFLTRTLTAYAYHRDQFGPEFRRRLLAWGIVHRHSNLAWWMRRLPEPAQPVLGALADRWFATELARNQPGSGSPAVIPHSSHSGTARTTPDWYGCRVHVAVTHCRLA